MRDAFLKNAPAYFAKNFDVVPLNGKRPFTPDWVETSYRDLKVVHDDFGRILPLSMRNIGLKTGKKSGVIVVDIDLTDKDLQQKVYDKLGECICGKKGNRNKGINYFFKYNGEESRAFEGIDILSDGKQTVLPPSDHDSGCEYEWVGTELLNDPDLPNLPPDTIKWLEENFAKSETSVELVRGEGRCSHGSHNKISQILMAMIHDGCDVDEIAVRLLEYDEEINPEISYFLCPSRKEFRTNSKKANCIQMISQAMTRTARSGELPERVQVEIRQEPKKKEKKRLHRFRGIAQEIFENIYNNSPVPRSRFAYGSTLATMSIIVGNKIQFRGIHPNLYCLLIAPSGSGKDFPMKYPKKLLSKYDMKDLLGQENPASDSGVIMTLSKQPKRIDTIDEADTLFSTINTKNNATMAKIADVYASLYTSCGEYYAGKITASKGRSGQCENPFISMIGSITPAAFRDSVTTKLIEKGLGARFLYFIDERYKKGVPSDNFTIKNPKIDSFVNRWKNFEPIGIPRLEIEDKAHGDLIDVYNMCEQLKEKKFNTQMAPIYNRLYENLIKFLIIDTVSTNYKTTQPVIGRDNVRWATKAVEAYVSQMEHFILTNVSSNDVDKNRKQVLRIIEQGKISKTQLNRRTQSLNSSQRNHYIKELLESGEIAEEIKDKSRFYFAL